uniref:Sensory neuron membrane protein 1 n=1 Tax=Drosicha corpulenta TaxID=535978 RepID=A0A0U3JF09_9HEMI|nr:sensory neuron membrane protein 1 [Drosicha corpulenta]
MATSTTWTVSGVIFISLGIFIGWYLFPNTIKSQVGKAKLLRKGNEMRTAWAKFPISLDFKIYLFNVTNPEEVENGGKPIMQQVGPYFFHEWKEKVNLVDDPKEDTVSYNFLNSFMFNASVTQPLTGMEKITMPHPLMLALTQITEEIKPSALNVANKAHPHILGTKDSFLVTDTAMNILFDGLLVNCSKHKEFAANAVCGQLKANPKGLVKLDEDNFLFSFFGAVNGTPYAETMTVKRGMQNVMDVGQVVMFDGKSKMDKYSGDPCNDIRGTDTTIFPPFMGRSDVWSFGAEICRSMPAKYVRDAEYNGIMCYYYDADFGDMSTDPDLKCFCPTNTTCLKKGAFSLQQCTGAPIIATLPHFFKCHEDYINGVGGVNPTEEDHGIRSYFEPITGTPLSGRRRLQFNMFLKNVPKITVLQNITGPPVLVPLIWIEEGVDLGTDITGKVKTFLYTAPSVMNKVRYVLVLIGILMIGYAVFKHYNKTKLESDGSKADSDNKTTITQVSPAY